MPVLGRLPANHYFEAERRPKSPTCCIFEVTTNQNTMTKVQDFIQSNQLPEERFLPVTNFEGRFWISDHGRVLSVNGRYAGVNFLKPHLDSLGYYNTQLRKKPQNRKCRVHQLVGEHFCEMIYVPGHKMVWNHKDGNKLNNHYTNVEFVTNARNIQHAVETGLFNIKGEKHPHSKLTEDDVRLIRALYLTGQTHQHIADKFGICRRQAGDIINRVNWGWLV